MAKFKTRTSTNSIVIHCSATKPSQDIGATDIRRWHKAKGLIELGYHFVIKRDGSVEPARAIEAHGAHLQTHNSNSVAICLVGGVSEDYQDDPSRSPQDNRKLALRDSSETNFTDAQFTSLWSLLKTLEQTYPFAAVLGHNELAQTNCPSFNVQEWLHIARSLATII